MLTARYRRKATFSGQLVQTNFHLDDGAWKK